MILNIECWDYSPIGFILHQEKYPPRLRQSCNHTASLLTAEGMDDLIIEGQNCEKNASFNLAQHFEQINMYVLPQLLSFVGPDFVAVFIPISWTVMKNVLRFLLWVWLKNIGSRSLEKQKVYRIVILDKDNYWMYIYHMNI